MTDSSMSHDRRHRRRDDDDDTTPPTSQDDNDLPYHHPHHDRSDSPTSTPDHFQEIRPQISPSPQQDHLWLDQQQQQQQQQHHQHSIYHRTLPWITAMVVGLLGVRLWYRHHHGSHHDAPGKRPPRTNDDDDDRNIATTTTARIRSFLRPLVTRLVTGMEDLLIYGIYDYAYRLYQMVIEWTLYSIQYAVGVWHYCSQVTVSLQRLLLRQQRLDYYNHNNNSYHHNDNHYNENRHSTRRGMSQLPDLVEATVDMNVVVDHVADRDHPPTTTTTTCERPSEPLDESTTTNPMIMDNNNDNATTNVPVDHEASLPLPTTTFTDPTTMVPSKTSVWLLELEPAFVNERDYPSNWMVYHPILQRVILKIQADAYHPHSTSLRDPKP